MQASPADMRSTFTITCMRMATTCTGTRTVTSPLRTGTPRSIRRWRGSTAVGLGRIALLSWLRPFVVGLVHGLAGSAAVALMVLSIIREPVAALGYLLLFGLGTIVGMMLITLILSAPFAFTAVNLPKFNWRLRVASGLISFVFGVVLIYGIGFAEGGLFTDAPTWQPH